MIAQALRHLVVIVQTSKSPNTPLYTSLNRLASAPRWSKLRCGRTGDPEPQIKAFIAHYSHQRYHDSLGNVMPANAYCRRDRRVLDESAAIKRQAIEHRRLQHHKPAA